tara:strand:+ start:629 stop:832 length:204 start_codon:yes stop_codon:yes gene_type:complete
MRIYLIDDRQVDYQQYTQAPHKWTDEEFIEFAEHEGTVYSLEGFQNQWNTNQLIEEIEVREHWIRIL